MWPPWKSDCQGGGAGFRIISGEAVIADGSNRNSIDTGGVAITITVIIRETTISCGPHKDVSLSTTALFKRCDMLLIYVHNLHGNQTQLSAKKPLKRRHKIEITQKISAS